MCIPRSERDLPPPTLINPDWSRTFHHTISWQINTWDMSCLQTVNDIWWFWWKLVVLHNGAVGILQSLGHMILWDNFLVLVHAQQNLTNHITRFRLQTKLDILDTTIFVWHQQKSLSGWQNRHYIPFKVFLSQSILLLKKNAWSRLYETK